MKAFLKNFICIFIFLIAYSCSKDDNTIPEEIIIPPEEIILSPSIEVYNAALLENSYVLAVENASNTSYLIDKAGQVIHEWNFDKPLGNDFELLANGKILGIFKTTEPDFSFGGFGGIIRILNADGSTDWEFNYASTNYLAHHDVEMLSNGNVLFLAWERISVISAQQAGVKTDIDIFPETLIEVDPQTNQIVWEWHSIDHIVQEEYPDSSNYGIINENPKLIDINYHSSDVGDIMHGNGIDHDEVKDLIYISINGYSEVWVVDHSTTSEEAKTNAGGNYNKGGDLLYRFGNPEAYNDTVGKRLFYKNHFPNFLENNEPGAGNILIYGNGQNIKQSTVYELKLPDVLSLDPNDFNEPEIVWSFTDPELFYGSISGAVRLKNGNTLICEGGYGFWEVTSKGEVVWKYKRGDVPFWRCYAYLPTSPEIVGLGL